MDDVPLPLGGEEPRRDFARMFDLDRSTLIKNLVDEIEDRMRTIEIAQDDLKILAASAKEKEFSPRDIAAMKAVAKLRLKDKTGEAREKLESLDRISRAVGLPLFDYATVRG